MIIDESFTKKRLHEIETSVNEGRITEPMVRELIQEIKDCYHIIRESSSSAYLVHEELQETIMARDPEFLMYEIT